MVTGYVVAALATAAANVFAAVVDFRRCGFVVRNSTRLGVPLSWLTMLGALKAAGAAGLLVGLLGVPVVGEAAAGGLVLFFLGAVTAHLRARYYALASPLVYLSLAVATLVLDLSVAGVVPVSP